MPDFKAYVQKHLPPLGVSGAEEAEIIEELALEFQQQYERAICNGASPEEAWDSILKHARPWDELAKELRAVVHEPFVQEHGATKQNGIARYLDTLSQDIRYGTRVLRKHWKLASIAVFSLSIAMALGVLSLSLINNFLFLPPAGQDPSRLVVIYSHTPERENGTFSYLDYQYYRSNNHVFTDVAAMPASINISYQVDKGSRVSLVARPVSDNYFGVLGIHPFLGRLFAPGDDRSREPLAVMTYSCWQRLGADPNIVGKNIAGSTIVGVTPKEYIGSMWGANADLLTHLPQDEPDFFNKRNHRSNLLLARLKPGVTRRQAQIEMSAMSEQLASAYPEDDKDLASIVNRATMLPPDAIADAELSTSILSGLVLLVLLIACGNVANLLLAVAVGRRQEAAIKLALGAQRGRLIREFLRESALICGSGAVFGFVLAAAVLRRYPSFSFSLPTVGTFEFGLSLRLDGTVISLTAVLTLIAILATGLAPALYASSPNLSAMLAGEIVGARKKAKRNILVTAQVAVCTLSLIGTGLCARSLFNVRNTDPGIGTKHLIAIQVGLAQAQEAEGREFFDKVRKAVETVGGVESVTFAESMPLFWGGGRSPVQTDPTANKIPVAHDIVDIGYFETLRIPIIAGRSFNAADTAKAQNVAVINRKMAETFWPGQNPVGKSFLAGDPAMRLNVVGVTENGKYEDLEEPTLPVMYFASAQHYQQVTNVIARTSGDPRLWIEPLRRAIGGVSDQDAGFPVTFDDIVNFNLVAQRVATGCVAVLSALGLLLAILGLLGEVSYSVSERKRELGIRVALGAQRRQLMQMILRQTLWVTSTGVAIGALLGVSVAIFLRSQFYGVSAVEWRVLVPVGAGMIAVSLTVAYISAWPWLAVDPLEAVRHS